MSLSVGIVGLPNSGKSTLFNALLRRQVADVAEYPFTTVEPNTGVVEVPDKRLDKLVEVLKIPKKVPAVVKFIDIAGLIKGAHEGEGLGNRFLEQIRQVDAILHLVRGFTGNNIPHVSGEVDPVHDVNTVNLELTLADFEVVTKALEKPGRLEVLDKIKTILGQGKPASEAGLSGKETELVKDLNLLTLKPMLYALNLDEAAVKETKEFPDLPPVMIISAKLEAEINELEIEDRLKYLEELGLSQSLLDRLIEQCYRLLNLITFYTVKGGKQAQAWPLVKGKTALEAAEMVHTDFSKNFIKAEAINWQDLVNLGGWKQAREKGKVRLEGRDYVMREGDVVEFKIGS